MRRILFLNDEFIEEMENLRRVVNQPTKHELNPVLEPDKPWERGGISHYGTVLYDAVEGIYRFWYFARPGRRGESVQIAGRRWRSPRSLLCYASSHDLLQWEKPVLQQVEFEGSHRNNILRIGELNPEGVAILHEPDDSDRPYKALYWEHGTGGIEKSDDGAVGWKEGERDGIWVSFSKDGLHWEDYDGNPVIAKYSDTSHYVVIDPETGRYYAFGRFGFGRRVARIESEDFLQWSQPELVLEPDENETSGPWPDTQFYGMTVDIYEGLYIGMLWVYRPGTDARIDTQLAVSTDGRKWERVGERATFLPLGPEGSRDDGMVRPAGKLLVGESEIKILYGMVQGPHSSPRSPRVREEKEFAPSAIGLAYLRRDGFVCIEAGQQAGTLLTKKFRVDGSRLYINADARGGKLCVSLCDGNRKHISGFRSSEPITGDHLKAQVRWKDSRLSSLSGREVRLRFLLRRAKLYSCWVE